MSPLKCEETIEVLPYPEIGLNCSHSILKIAKCFCPLTRLSLRKYAKVFSPLRESNISRIEFIYPLTALT